MDIETDIHRGRLTSASPNSSRESSMSFMAYMNRVQALASSLAWADQVEDKRSQDSSLSYVTIKEGENNSTNPA